MKIATLLAQYLYSNHRLDLPGIGTFLLDPSFLPLAENSKQRATLLEGITFENNSSLKEPEELIAFISSQSGKMKALAQADLGSHLQLAQQFLNISKPFTFEGIGTLTTLKTGEYRFTPIMVSPDKLKEQQKVKESAASTKEVKEEYESFLSKSPAKTSWRKPVVALLIMAGIGAAVWGGYLFSKKEKPAEAENMESGPIATIPAPPPDTIPADTQVAPIQVPDSLQKTEPIAEGDTYKYVLEIADSKRAFERYYRLKAYQWQVQMETKDSVQYKLFLVLSNQQHADTTRIMDSLTVMNGRKVYIEHQNN